MFPKFMVIASGDSAEDLFKQCGQVFAWLATAGEQPEQPEQPVAPKQPEFKLVNTEPKTEALKSEPAPKVEEPKPEPKAEPKEEPKAADIYGGEEPIVFVRRKLLSLRAKSRQKQQDVMNGRKLNEISVEEYPALLDAIDKAMAELEG